MRDQRIDKWANTLVSFSLCAKPHQSAFLLGDPEAMPLIEAVYEKLILAGVKVECFLLPRSFSEFLLKNGSEEQLSFTPLARLAGVQKYDFYLSIGANSNSKMLSQIDPKQHRLASIGNKIIVDTILERSAQGEMSWCLTMFPTSSAAQDAEMGNKEYEEFVLNAGFLNDADPIKSWEALEKRQNHLIQVLEKKKELLFQNAQGTNLRVNIQGMKWVNCCGRINFPDGEVYTGPNLQAPNGGVNGIVRYSLPTIYRNVEVHDIELHFKNGAVVQAKASKNEAFLHEMIAQDAGAKFVGEIALGTNYRIQKCTKNILFDEKIGGTFHLALGKGYPETGNRNESALHWDMIFDLRPGGTIYADEEVIVKDGRFIHEEWPC